MTGICNIVCESIHMTDRVCDNIIYIILVNVEIKDYAIITI